MYLAPLVLCGLLLVPGLVVEPHQRWIDHLTPVQLPRAEGCVDEMIIEDFVVGPKVVEGVRRGSSREWGSGDWA